MDLPVSSRFESPLVPRCRKLLLNPLQPNVSNQIENISQREYKHLQSEPANSKSRFAFQVLNLRDPMIVNEGSTRVPYNIERTFSTS